MTLSDVLAPKLPLVPELWEGLARTDPTALVKLCSPKIWRFSGRSAGMQEAIRYVLASTMVYIMVGTHLYVGSWKNPSACMNVTIRSIDVTIPLLMTLAFHDLLVEVK